MNIVVNKLLTNYELAGKGKLILMLHGWGDSGQGLAGMQKQLTVKPYRILVLDLPGFGGSQAPKTVWNLDDYAQFLRDMLDKLNLEQPYAVIGHSNGGALAVRATALGLLKPQKLVLLAASGIRGRGGAKRLGLKVIAKTGKAASVWLPARQRRALRQGLYGAAGSDMLVVPELQETFKKTVRQDVQADAAAITIPTLLIYAEDDKAVPLSDGKTYHQLIKGSILLTIKQAGHFVHLDQSQQVTKLIEEFLQ